MVSETDTIESVAESFVAWSAHAHGSPLYQRLARAVAEDPQLASIAAEIEHRPRQNILFGAVHVLLSPEDPLAHWYPSLHPSAPAPEEGTVAAFTRFVTDHREQILHIGRTRYVQTNEPRRCGPLLPYLAREADRLGEPVHVIEIGAAAGLNLCLDRYVYRYTSGTVVGHSSLEIFCDDRGLVPIPERTPFIQRRVGIDLHPVDIDDPDQVAWLDALVWPEHVERRRRLAAAIAVRRSEQVTMVAGDASRVLTGVTRTLPTSGPVLVWHSFSWNQMSDRQRSDLDEALHEVGRGRSVMRIGWEYWDREAEWPEIRVGLTTDRMSTVARAHPHGEWVEAI